MERDPDAAREPEHGDATTNPEQAVEAERAVDTEQAVEVEQAVDTEQAVERLAERVADPPPASPAESLRLIAGQRAEARRRVAASSLVIHVSWGLTWLLGFGALFARYGPDGRVFVHMPGYLPLVVLFGLAAIAMAGTLRYGRRMRQNIAGRSAAQGLAYGLAWLAGFGGIGAVAGHLDARLPTDEKILVWGALATGMVGVLYIAGAAIWRESWLLWFGGWLAAVNMVGVWLGPGWHSLVVSLAAGGGLIGFGLLARWWPRPARPDGARPTARATDPMAGRPDGER